MKLIDPNKQESAGEEGSFPTGQHVINGFEWFNAEAYRDLDGKPILVQQFDTLVGRLNFKLENENPGPPMSIELSEMSLLVKAFSGDVNSLPEVPDSSQIGLVSEYMIAVEKLGNTGESIKVFVNDAGWVGEVQGMVVPDDNFIFAFDGFTRFDDEGNPFLQVSKFNADDKYFFVKFRVVQGEGGTVTPYKNCTFTESMSYDVVVGAGDTVDWKRTSDGSETSGAIRMSKLMLYTANMPDEFDPPNPHNILRYWMDNLDPSRLLKGTRSYVKPGKNASPRLNNIKLIWNTLKPASGTSAPVNVPEPVVGVVNKELTDQLITLLGYLEPNHKAVVKPNTTDFTPEGVSVARKYITPVKQAGKVVNGQLNELNYEEISAIFDYVIENTDDNKIKDLQAQFLGRALGFDVPEEVELETPF